MKGLCGLHLFHLYYLEDMMDVMHQSYHCPGPATSLVWSSSIASNCVKSWVVDQASQTHLTASKLLSQSDGLV